MYKTILLLCISLTSFADRIYFSDTVTVAVNDNDTRIAKMDSLWVLEKLSAQQLQIDSSRLNSFNYSSDSVPIFSDSLIQNRLSKLDNSTPFKLAYNKAVQTQINVYSNTYRNHISRMLGKAKFYFPLFESKLDEYELPMEFKYLAIVESALNPKARSRSAATGLWQFMYATGKIYDLNITSYIDERCDPIKSTVAACEYFTFLYKMFNNWELVLAAYNGGPGYVSRAMRKTGAKDYWSVRPYLRLETQNYVPKFIAMNYIMNYAPEHNILPMPYDHKMEETDTISLNQSITFDVLSETLGVNIDLLRDLNPIYKRDLVPVDKGHFASIRLPYRAVATFINNSDSIYSYSESLQEKYIPMDAPIVHRVKKGEYLGKIASLHHTTVGRIKTWNNLSSTKLSIGQKLIIYVNPDFAPKDKQSSLVKTREETEYTVKVGDTLWDIARRYNGVSVAQIEKLNNITFRELKPGAVLRIPKTG
tara:strand:- start:3137 stop:4567 length:1431 start_codon:yes stop_codon:yes gene_type:complete